MSLQNFQYDMIMRDYNRKQAENRYKYEQRVAETYRKLPRLKEIDDEVATLSASKVRALLNGTATSTTDLKKSIAVLRRERETLLTANNYPQDYLEMSYDCPLCQDTGYIDDKKCICFKKAEVELLYAQSNLKEILKKENFEHFSFEYYSDTIKNDSTGLSSLETAQRAYHTAKEFVHNFDRKFQNLFIYGNTGVGKTFLSHCIAHELLDSAHCVLYFSAYDLFDLLAKSAFSKKSDTLLEE